MLTVIENKTILYISNVDMFIDNGPGINEREFIKSLARRYPDNTCFLIPKPSVSTHIYNNHFIFCHRLVKTSVIHLMLHVLTQFYYAVKLLRGNKVDLIIFRLGIFPIAPFLISWVFGKKYVVKTLGDFCGTGRTNDGFVRKTLYGLNKIVTLPVLLGASAIDACTQKLIDCHRKHLKHWRGKFKLIENATNIEMFHPMDEENVRKRLGLEKYDHIVGYVGGRPDIGARALIEVSPRLVGTYPNCGIVFVGGRGIDELKKRARDLQTFNRCLFTGQIKYEELPRYINSFDVCVSLPPMERVAGIGNSSQKVRQYIACGKPVISVRGENLFIEKYGIGKLVDTGSVEEVYEAVSYFFDLDRESRTEISKKAREYAIKNLSIEAALDKRLEFWEKAVFDDTC